MAFREVVLRHSKSVPLEISEMDAFCKSLKGIKRADLLLFPRFYGNQQ
jgi:hypothetical protein